MSSGWGRDGNGSGSGGTASRGRRAASLPLPMPGASSSGQAYSYPSGDEAGLLRKLLKRRSSGALQIQAPQLSSAQLRKNRDKMVALLEEGQLQWEDAAAAAAAARHQQWRRSLDGGDGSGGGSGDGAAPVGSMPGEDELLPLPVEELPPTATGRITIHCTAASYDLKGLKEHLERGGHSCTEYPEVLYSRYVKHTGEVTGEIMAFDFGAACFWDLSPEQERKFLDHSIQPYEEGKLASAKVESDNFSFRLVPYSKPSIQNDIITLSPNMKDAHLVKLSISFALAQSTKLSVLEERALSLADITRSLPTALARDGKVKVSDRDVAKLMGRVFIEQAALNLLGSVLDTPDFFWEPGVPDNLQKVYDKVWEYLELGDRIEVLNARLAVLHELLDMLRLQGQAQHSDFMEVIIILLIVCDCVILLFQLAALLGYIGDEGGGDGGDGEGSYGDSGWGSALAAVLSWRWTLGRPAP